LNVSIAGLGLIGGSLALALKTRHRVSGFDIDASTREAALAAGIDIVGALEELLPADAVIVATPMAAIVPTLASLAQRSGNAVLLDVASVRAPVEAFGVPFHHVANSKERRAAAVGRKVAAPLPARA